MTATKPAVNATRQETTGIVTYSFVWTNLATRSGERLRVGDALTGFYLDDGQQLTITWPAGYELARVRPSPDSRQATALRWNASTTFGETEPLVELAQTNQSAPNPPSSTEASSPLPNSSIGTPSVGTSASSGGQTTATRSASGGGAKTNASDGGQTSSTTNQLQTLLVVVAAVVGLVLLAAIRYRRHRNQKPQSLPNEAITNPGSESTSEADESGGSQTELLSNEERVMQVLERAGGRAKQQHVVEELDWTDAKTSQVVRNLREDGAITSFRLGRENVLELADTETDGDNSPAE